ncbi:MAG: hypothetical protein ABSA85_05035 [Terracidiphilus sp.]|jgi:hypothetical protein
MKLVLTIAAVLVLAGSLVADYKWRQWMAARRRERDDSEPRAGR